MEIWKYHCLKLPDHIQFGNNYSLKAQIFSKTFLCDDRRFNEGRDSGAARRNLSGLQVLRSKTNE